MDAVEWVGEKTVRPRLRELHETQPLCGVLVLFLDRTFLKRAQGAQAQVMGPHGVGGSVPFENPWELEGK